MADKILSSTQAHLPIGEIKEGTVVMRDGSLRGVILVSSLNFALKSDEEKDAIVFSFQNFLNSLEYSLQIVANSRKLDLTTYLESVRQSSMELKSSLIKLQSEEYISFINSLLETANIMEKRFFVVVPYYPVGVEDVQGVAKLVGKKSQSPQSSFDENKRGLILRMEQVISGLTGVGLRAASLSTEDLLELYYSLWNPDTAKNQHISSMDLVNNEPLTEGGQNAAL